MLYNLLSNKKNGNTPEGQLRKCLWSDASTHTTDRSAPSVSDYKVHGCFIQDADGYF